MNETIEKIGELSTGKKLGILGGTIGFVLVIFYLYFYSGTVEERDKLTKAVSGVNGLKVKIAQEEGIVQNLDQFREEVKKLDGELDVALKELPDEKEIAALLSKISDKARDAGLDIKSFKTFRRQEKRLLC